MWCRFDFIIIWWALSSSVVYIMLWGTLAAVTRKCGNLLDVLGIYWLFRYNIRSWDDIFLALKTLAVCSVVMTFFVIPEWATGKNPFSILGRVTIPIRGGKSKQYSIMRWSVGIKHAATMKGIKRRSLGRKNTKIEKRIVTSIIGFLIFVARIFCASSFCSKSDCPDALSAAIKNRQAQRSGQKMIYNKLERFNLIIELFIFCY